MSRFEKKGMEVQRSLDINMDSLICTSAQDSRLRIWRLGCKPWETSFEIPNAEIANALKFNKDGTWIAAACYGNVRVYDVHTQLPVFRSKTVIGEYTIRGEFNCVGIEKTTSCQIYTGGDDGCCRFWDPTQTRLPMATLYNPGQRVTAMLQNGSRPEIFFATNDHAGMWDLSMNTFMWFPTPLMEVAEYVVRFELHPNGRRLLGATSSGRLMAWDLGGYKVPLPIVREAPNVPFFYPTHVRGKLVDDQKRKKLTRIGHSVRYSPDGKKIAMAGDQHEIVILDADTLKEVKKIPTASEWNYDAIFSKNGRYVFTGGDDGCLSTYDAIVGGMTSAWKKHYQQITAMDIHMGNEGVPSRSKMSNLLSQRL